MEQLKITVNTLISDAINTNNTNFMTTIMDEFQRIYKILEQTPKNNSKETTIPISDSTKNIDQNEIHMKIFKLEQSFNHLEKQIQPKILQSPNKNNNIIMWGLPEQGNETTSTLTSQVKSIINNGLDLVSVKIQSVSRFGKINISHHTPIRICFKSVEEKVTGKLVGKIGFPCNHICRLSLLFNVN